MPIISVIVPVYNSDKYICNCVESILQQSLSDFEVIIIDDGSNDNSGRICDEYASKDPRIQVVHKTNGGQAEARNIGVSLAKGEWISFVDSDDIIHPKMLEILLKSTENNSVQLCMCSAIEGLTPPDDFYNDKAINVRYIEIEESTIERLINNGNYKSYVVWAKLIKKEIVIKYPFVEGRIYEDNAIVLWWIQEAGKLADIDAALYFYTSNPQGTMHGGKIVKKAIDSLWSEMERIRFFEIYGYKDLTGSEYRTYVLLCAYQYQELQKIKKKGLLSKCIKNKCLTSWYDYRKTIILTKEEKEYVLGSFWPKTIKAYSYLNKLLQIVFSQVKKLFDNTIGNK